MKITYYEQKHLKQCATLFTEIYNSEGYNCNFDIKKSMLYLEELSQNSRFIGFLLLKKEEIIGLAFCHEHTWDQNDELKIDEFLIKENYQKKEFGTKLLNFIEKYAKNNELAGITLITNTISLTNFYQKNNFLEHDVTFMYKGLVSSNANN